MEYLSEAAYLAGLFFIGFLFQLSTFLRGRNKEQLSGMLVVVLTVQFLASFFLFYWQFGLICVVATFMFMGMIEKPAAGLAGRMLGIRVGTHKGSAQKISEAYKLVQSGEISMQDWMQMSSEESERQDRVIKALAERPHIAKVLETYGASAEDFKFYFSHLELGGLSDIAMDIVNDPDQLSLLIEMIRDKKGHPMYLYPAFRKR